MTQQKIYFFAYASAFQNVGGGEVLLLKTKEYLEKLGVTVSLFDVWNDRFAPGDFLHVFGSVKETLGLMEVAKSKGVTVVHSPVLWYNWQSSLGIPYSARERLMCAVRQAVKTLFPFAPNARQKMMGVSDVVLGASVGEARQIRRYFLIPSDKIDVVTYGANEHYLQATPELFEKKWSVRNFILAVGRIEPRKNQLKLIRAANRLGHNLVIIGNPVSHHQSYYDRCQREAGPQVHFLGGLASDSDLLASAFAACAVYVLPSWFETPGLAALEAGLSGAKVVITQGGPTQEYFQDLVDYMNPASEKDIAEKIKKALRRKPSQALRKHINSRYLWKHTAEQTLHIYQKLGFQHTLRSAAIPS